MTLTKLTHVLAVALSILLWASPTMAANKRIGIIVFDGVLTSDITAPIEVFGVASKKAWFDHYEVITINVSSSEYISTEEGLAIKVDDYLKNRPQVDVLLMPSSYHMDPLIKNKDLIKYIKDTAKQAEWMASNCSGAFVLAEAGILSGKKATTWAGGESDLKRDYPEVDVQFDSNFVIDGNVITSNGSVVSYQAAFALLEQMSSTRRAEEVREALQSRRLW